MLTPTFDLQGHRGARGLKPENTLPSFEVAIDVGVTTIETDLHLSRDGVPVIAHDPYISERLCRRREGANVPDPTCRPAIATLTMAELRGYRADRNPDPARFPSQDAAVTPLAKLYADERGLDPYGLPALTDLLTFAALYAGELGRRAGKTDAQRTRARTLRFDLELKRVPFFPENIGEGTERSPRRLLERKLLDSVLPILERITVRSFDHRSVRFLKEAQPGVQAAALVAGTAPIAPEKLAQEAGAGIYGPEYTFLDAEQVQRLHAAGVRVVPWTVNDPAAMRRLLDWAVDGITTDYPNHLADILRERGIPF
jgi:glycerophosphoryl diester phosphodiesterase